MKCMSAEEFKEWIKENPMELTKTECSQCRRRTECCIFCNTFNNQPERLNPEDQLASPGKLICDSPSTANKQRQ